MREFRAEKECPDSFSASRTVENPCCAHQSIDSICLVCCAWRVFPYRGSTRSSRQTRTPRIFLQDRLDCCEFNSLLLSNPLATSQQKSCPIEHPGLPESFCCAFIKLTQRVGIRYLFCPEMVCCITVRVHVCTAPVLGPFG